MEPLAPIIVFAHRRPRHLLALLESLRADPLARGSRLTIYCDGSRTPHDDAQTAEVREVARSQQWCGQVEVVERQQNLGLANSVLHGVDEALARSDRVIVLEDDLVLSPRFLEFMSDALRRYEGVERVLQVSGYMFPITLPRGIKACFLPMISSWGWATWRRAWAPFQLRRMDIPVRPCSDKNVQATVMDRHRFDLDGSYPFVDMLERQLAGLLDSWAIRWYQSVFERDGLTLFPALSYVRNDGWDGSGTHCARDSFFDVSLCEDLVHEFPKSIDVTPPAYAALKAYFRSRFSRPRSGLFHRIVLRLANCWRNVKEATRS